MTATYLPGELATLVTDDGVVLAAADRLAEVLALSGRSLEPLPLVEILSRGVLTDLPDFAVVRRAGDGLGIVVRGAFVVRAGDVEVTGQDAATWNEVSVPVVAGQEVRLLPATTTPGGPALPIGSGVVRSGGVTWWPAGAPEAPAQPAPPVAAPPVAAPPVPAPPVVPPAPATPVAPAAEHTALRGARSAAPAPTSPPPPAPPAPAGPSPAAWSADPSTDHDGRTITPAQLQALRAGQVPVGVPVGLPADVPVPPPTRPLVALELSTGRVVPVRRRVLIGRSPRVQQVGGSANLPALVTVDDPYVSSTHLEVASDGHRVTVTDTSTNGTLLARAGRTPFPLEHGVATEVSLGDVLTLSKGLTATVVPATQVGP